MCFVFISPPLPARDLSYFEPSARSRRRGRPRYRSSNAWSIPCSTTGPHDQAQGKTSSAEVHRQFWARQAARALTNEFLFGGEHAAVGTAESDRHSERLRFHGYYVGGARRLHNPERHRFGDRHDQQRSAFVCDLGDRLDIFNRPKEIRRLNQDACRIVAHPLLELLQIDLSRVRERDRLPRNLPL